MIVLSHFTVAPLLEARTRGADSAIISTDLGLSEMDVSLIESAVVFPNGQELGWDTVEEIARTETTCFHVLNGRAERIQIYSQEFERFYSLYPTKRAPTMMAAGFPMHRIKEIDPHRDTVLKVKTIGPVFGEALDTCTGLGYTAIEMAKTASKVTTIELDPAVQEIGRLNPWSQELFTNLRIQQRIGDAFELVAEMPEESFARIVHDPPTLKLAGELYSGEMYRQLHRVLKRGGRLFHYIGNPDSAHGRSTTRGVMRRLQEAGFERVVRHPEAFGVVGFK